MPFPAFQDYIHSAVPGIPWRHWALMSIVVIFVIVWGIWKKKWTPYGSIVFGSTVLVGLFLIETAVVARLGREGTMYSGFDYLAEYQRITHGTLEDRIQMFSNFAVFIPLGLLISEFLHAIKHSSAKRCLYLTTIYGFFLSLGIEVTQWVFQVGFFELTDTVLNTLGTVAGAVIVLLIRHKRKAILLSNDSTNH